MPEVADSSGLQPAGHFDYYPLPVARIIRETDDACSLVFDIPPQLQGLFSYKAGQYLTLRATVNGEQVERCYSLSSSPHTDTEHRVTVIAIADGRLSNWLNTRLREGDVIEVMPANGRFCLRDNGADLLMYCAGSGITPCLSIVKTALATSTRNIRMLYANRDRASIIFADELAALQNQYPERFELIHNLDVENGFVTGELVRSVAADRPKADCYICGPGPFMEIVESTLLAAGVDRHNLFIERFLADDKTVESDTAAPSDSDETPETVTVILGSQHIQLTYKQGDTLLDTARDQGLGLPFSCRIGACATCIAKVVEGRVHMVANHVLSDEEVADGYVLVCQSLPLTRHVAIKYQ